MRQIEKFPNLVAMFLARAREGGDKPFLWHKEGEAWVPLSWAEAARQVVLIATGSEVAVALESAAALEAQGVGADVVSMPCMELFEAQDAAYRAEIVPADSLVVTIEAGVTHGWERYAGPNGLSIGLDRFGASAPAEVLFAHFGFTAEAIVPKILAKLGK